MIQDSSSNTIGYEDWNKAISEYFYNPRLASKPVYLQLDPETLTQIGEQFDLDNHQAKTSFIVAVQSWLRRNSSQYDQFDNFLRNARKWEGLDIRRSFYTPPPFLAFLGLCVLAASQMNADDDVSAANYYIHLNELLGFGRKRGQPRGFDQIDELWVKLRWWLDEVLEGKFGYATATNHYGGAHIGYPISQCLLRRTDREKLPDFFKWSGIEPGDDSLQSNDFPPMLREWAGKFSLHGRRIFERDNKELISQIAELTFSEFQLWDGSSVDSTGSRFGDIKLQLEFSRRKFECALYARATQDFPDGNYQNLYHQSIRLQRPFPNADWFNPLDETLLVDVLDRKSLVLSHDKFKYQFRPQSIIPFRNDIDSGLGGWVSCGKVGLGEKHFVLCHQDFQTRVEAYFQTYAEPGWKIITSRQEIFPEKGWLCFYNVRISKRVTHEIEDELACLAPPLRVGIKLSGGLKVKQGIWLKGGEPEAIISIDSDQATPIYIDEQKVDVVSEKSAVIQLSKLNLTAERHEIRVGERRASFAICESGAQLLGKQTQTVLGHLIQRDDSIFTTQSIDPVLIPNQLPANHLYVTGASLIGAPDDVAFPIENLLILPYGGRHYIILGRRPGEAEKTYQIADMPLWIAAKGGYLQGHKVTVPFEPQWIIKIKGNQKVLLAVGSAQPPRHDIYEDGDLLLWQQWAGKTSLQRNLDKGHRSVWQQYNQVAKELR